MRNHCRITIWLALFFAGVRSSSSSSSLESLRQNSLFQSVATKFNPKFENKSAVEPVSDTFLTLHNGNRAKLRITTDELAEHIRVEKMLGNSIEPAVHSDSKRTITEIGTIVTKMVSLVNDHESAFSFAP